MSRHVSLRARIVISYVLFGALLSGFFAAGVYVAFDALEDEFVEETVSSELEEVLSRERDERRYAALTSTHMRLYVSDAPSWNDVPEAFATLPDGVTELALGEREYHIEARTVNGVRYMLAFDESDIEARQEKLGIILLVGVAACIYIATWAGFALSRQVIQPVARLSSEVSALVERGPETPLSGHYAADEVGRLADAFRLYQKQITEFLEREREFTGNVSHELRTPLTSIRSAVDLVMADPALRDVQRERLARIRRATEEIAELLDTFLLLARTQGESDELRETRPAEVVARVVDALRPIAQERGVTLRTVLAGSARLQLNMSAFGVVTRNLVHNAIVHGGTQVEVRFENDRLVVRNDGPGMDAVALSRAFERHFRGTGSGAGSGLGLSITRRLCDRFGWSITLDSEAGTITTASVTLAGRRLDEHTHRGA